MAGVRQKLNEIIFGWETPAGRRFDVVLIILILTSVAAVIVDSMVPVGSPYRPPVVALEWVFTLLFTVEYLVRIYCAYDRWRYMRSFYGIIDLASILPTYISLIFPAASYLLIVRLLRVLRVFRILKLLRYLSEANILARSLAQSRRKILVFFLSVLIMATVFGSLIFVVEGPENGFTSIPRSIYWTIVTITTVGYGDIVPQTVIGQMVASAAMLTGYSIIAIPTGIFTAELAHEMQRDRGQKVCSACSRSGHDPDALYCKYCGSGMDAQPDGDSLNGDVTGLN
jgi:voltage-gated potassium channel